MIDRLPARRAAVFLGHVLLLVAAPFAFAQDADTGTGEEGRLIVPLSGTAMVNRSSDLEASPSRVDTGLIEIGDDERLTITLTNTGNGDAIGIGEASIIGRDAHEYASDFAGFVTLEPGRSLDLSVTFTPSSPGLKSAGLRLDIDTSTSPYVVLFDGRSRYPLTSDLTVSTTRLSLGQVPVGQVGTGTLRLESVGDAAAPSISVTGIELGGDTPEAFEVRFTPTTLAPGEGLDVPVTMIPDVPGTKSADVTIRHDGNNFALEARFEGEVIEPSAVPVNFSTSRLKVDGVDVVNVTSIKFGPDGRLYYTERYGLIHVLDVGRKGRNDYEATWAETIDLVRKVPNHDDDGTPNPGQKNRLVTGMIVEGTAARPVIYATSSDPRKGGAEGDKNLDTNSGILHKLTRTGGGWVKQDLVRGIPRSEENHAPNGLVKVGDTILLVVGGHTNMGLPSSNFASLPEYALSAAVLEVDLARIGGGTHDLPTLDDEDRPGVDDANDPFGGNDGKNQAKLVADGPVRLYASGYRNAYDLTMTEAGRLYTFDNGPNSPWGDEPTNDCRNVFKDGGDTNPDNLHLIERGGHGGHPNPTRGNADNTFNDSNPQSPVEVAANPVECEYRGPGRDGALTQINSSVNGLDEYTASNFGSVMKGDLVAAGFNQVIYRLALNVAGDAVTSKSQLASRIGDRPLALTATGDDGPFPGTVWVGHVVGGDKDTGLGIITILEPSDY